MTNLDSILKSKNITLPTEFYIVKAMVSPVVTYGCENWTERSLNAEEIMLSNCSATPERRNPFPHTRTLTQASLTRKT